MQWHQFNININKLFSYYVRKWHIEQRGSFADIYKFLIKENITDIRPYLNAAKISPL